MPWLLALLFLFLAYPSHSQPATGMTEFPADDGLPGVFGTRASRPLRQGHILMGVTNGFGGGEGRIEDGILRLGPDALPVPVRDGLLYHGSLFLAGGLGAGFDAALHLPVYYESLSGAGDSPDPAGPGDLTAALTYGLPIAIPVLSLSLSATGSAPTSSRKGPDLPQQLAFYPASGTLPDALSHSLGMDAPRAGMGAGLSLDFTEAANGPGLKVHANAAADRVMAPGTDRPLGTFSASVAVEAALGKAWRLEGEIRQERLVAGPEGLGDPLERSTALSFGLGAKAWGGFSFNGGVRMAPSAWNPYMPLSWRDDAGVERSLAYRPLPAYAASFQIAWQGFPLDRDRDHDGVPDGEDLCPTVPEDRDGFQDEDGCPDPDNDHDGIPDKDDKCPNDPEDKDGFEDKDGCPDLDNDRDGIPDALDKCPNEAENRNGIEDEDGCPEADSDHDGIPDSRDKCPNEAEIINFYQDEDGCPDEKPEPIGDGVLAGVRFVGNTAGLDTASYAVLNDLAARLAAYPGTEIEVQGFLDDRAGPRAKALSRERAEAVVEYLAARGIELSRMKPVGYGSAQPLAPNRTAQGREKNRRIQIHRLD